MQPVEVRRVADIESGRDRLGEIGLAGEVMGGASNRGATGLVLALVGIGGRYRL